MLRCKTMHTLHGVLPVLCAPVRVTRSALVARRYTYAPPRCRTSQYRKTFISLWVSLWNDPADHVIDDVRLAGFKSRVNAFYWPKLLYPFSSSNIFRFLFFLSIGWYCGAGIFWLTGCRSLSPSLNCYANNNNNNEAEFKRFSLGDEQIRARTTHNEWNTHKVEYIQIIYAIICKRPLK